MSQQTSPLSELQQNSHDFLVAHKATKKYGISMRFAVDTLSNIDAELLQQVHDNQLATQPTFSAQQLSTQCSRQAQDIVEASWLQHYYSALTAFVATPHTIIAQHNEVIHIDSTNAHMLVHIDVPNGVHATVHIALRADKEELLFQGCTLTTNVQENAQLTIIQRVTSKSSTNSQLPLLCIHRHHQVHQNARLIVNDINCGNTIVSSHTVTQLNGNQAQANIYVIDKICQLTDNNITTYHNAPHTSSDLIVKGVVHSGKVLERGLVHISPQAHTSDGYQTQNILLLNGHAVGNALPQLEINNNDVRCSHGATVTHIKDEDTFYATSRGIPKKQAKQMMVQGFIAPVVEKLDISQEEKQNLYRQLEE